MHTQTKVTNCSKDVIIYSIKHKSSWIGGGDSQGGSIRYKELKNCLSGELKKRSE
jgi:hypothetical protein